MSRIQVVAAEAPKPGGAYSQGIVAGGFLYTAGVGPQDPGTSRVVGETIEAQTKQTMRNLTAILAAQGLRCSNVVKATVHLSDPVRDFKGFNSVYESFLAEPYPARTTVGSALLNILVEIDIIAVCEV